MKRSEKYKDTKWFHYYNANPKNRITGDCVVRALSVGTGIPYWDVLKGLYEMSVKTGYMVDDTKNYDKWLKTVGFVKCGQPKKPDGTKYTGKEFCDCCAAYSSRFDGNVIANIGGHHVVAFVEEDGRYRDYDIWDSTDGCIGNYWVREMD